MDIFLNVVLLLAGFVLLLLGANWFVDGAGGIAKKARISSMVIGLTVVAMGTSAPETAVSITGALQGSGGIAVGNIIGSNILNILLILGIAALIRPLRVQKTSLWIELPFLLLIAGLFLVFGYLGDQLSRVDGGILISLFVIFLIYTFWMAKRTRTPLLETSAEKAVESNRVCAAVNESSGVAPFNTCETAEGAVGKKPPRLFGKIKELKRKGETKLWFVILLTVVGLAMVIGGSLVAVDAAKFLARTAGISERVIGLTIVALGTSLPELFTSIVAAIKGNSEIAIGNIVGSNIFNILLVGGVAILIRPILFEPAFVIDSIINIAATAILFLFCVCSGKKNTRLGRVGGGILLAGYLCYTVYLFL